MSFLEKSLSKNEVIVNDVKLTKLALIPQGISASIFILLGLIQPFLLIGLIIPGWYVLYFFTVEQIVTNKKVAKKTGILSRKTDEMRLNKIESVEYKQSILGRVLNYGNVFVKGSGTTKLKLEYVCKPKEVKKSIDELID